MVNPPGKEGAYFYYEGYAPHPIGIGLGAGKSPEELAEFLTKATYADARPGGWDPAEQIKDNELDGVEADVLYTTLGFRIFWIQGCGTAGGLLPRLQRLAGRVLQLRAEAHGRIADDLALRPARPAPASSSAAQKWASWAR